jgi:hypothetical protein
VGGVLYGLAHRSDSTDSQTGQTQTGQTKTSQTDPPKAEPPRKSEQGSDFATYADTSGMFQVEVPREWVFRRSESDTTLDNAACHLVKAVVFPKDAEHAILDGWVSAGIRVSLYLPPSGQIWQTEWATDWQKRSFTNLMQGYSKFQNTTVEPVQLGNVAASTTAVMGESTQISEPEVARVYAGVSQKYLLMVEVAMPSSKRPVFESFDEVVRKTFELKVP